MLIKVIPLGGRLRIGGVVATLTDMPSRSEGVFVLDTGETFTVEATHATEVVPDVKMHAHLRGFFSKDKFRVAIDAPKSILICDAEPA